MKSSLSTQSKKINAVISLRGVDGLDSLDIGYLLSSYFIEWSFILHDKDVNDDGVLKTPHVNLVALLSKRTRLSTVMHKIADIFEVDDLAVSIETCSDYAGSLQYLIHKNDGNKFQYARDEIVSNIPSVDLNSILDGETDTLSYDRLVDLVTHSRSKLNLIEDLGLGLYRHYRPVINDIWYLIRGDDYGECK